jgi:hypothetical protein
MLIQKTNPVGIDASVQRLQAALHGELVKAWGLAGPDDPNYRSYGMIYRNKKDNQYIAEVYTGNNEYKEVYWDDRVSAISWFGLSGNIELGVKNTAKIHLVFFVNLAKLKPTVAHRADEEVRNEIANYFGNTRFGASLDTIELWTENVLREYPGSRRDDRLKAVDMHPVHCFRLNLTLLYSKNNC